MQILQTFQNDKERILNHCVKYNQNKLTFIYCLYYHFIIFVYVIDEYAFASFSICVLKYVIGCILY